MTCTSPAETRSRAPSRATTPGKTFRISSISSSGWMCGAESVTSRASDGREGPMPEGGARCGRPLRLEHTGWSRSGLELFALEFGGVALVEEAVLDDHPVGEIFAVDVLHHRLVGDRSEERTR